MYYEYRALKNKRTATISHIRVTPIKNITYRIYTFEISIKRIYGDTMIASEIILQKVTSPERSTEVPNYLL